MPASSAAVRKQRAASRLRHCTCKIKGSNLKRTGPSVSANRSGASAASISAVPTGSCDASSHTPAAGSEGA